MYTLKAAPLFYLLPLKEATLVTTRVLKVLKSSAKTSASGTLPENELTRLGTLMNIPVSRCWLLDGERKRLHTFLCEDERSFNHFLTKLANSIARQVIIGTVILFYSQSVVVKSHQNGELRFAEFSDVFIAQIPPHASQAFQPKIGLLF